MGASNSKNDGNKALLLCKERMRYIKQAVDLRYALSAAQLSYTQSLRNVGAALRQFAEAEISVDPSQSNFELEQTLSHSSYASPSPSLIPEILSSPHDGSLVSPRLSNVSYMRAAGSTSVKVTVESSPNHYLEEEGEESLTFPVPPPPPFPEIGTSWDFFDPVYSVDSIKIPNGEYAMTQHFGKFVGLRQNGHPGEEAKASQELTDDNCHSLGVENISINEVSPHKKSAGNKMVVSSFNNYSSERSGESAQTKACKVRGIQPECCGVNGSAEAMDKTTSIVLCRSKMEKAETDKRRETEKENGSMLISHEAKDFLSIVKDIEQRFIRAAEAGHEVSRMLETKKIRLSIHSEILGKSSDSFPPVFLSCCKVEKLSERDTIQHVTKVITWKRTVSSRSSSSRNPITSASKDDGPESGNDFVEEFSMISGSHSSTLDRLYAWERKLYDELKASESIRKAYDQKCNQLKHQFAKGVNPRVIDKTRATVKDLHSRVRVMIQAVDSISRRIEKLRDEELQPQLAELVQGLIRMWKAILECHQAQHLAISSDYLAKNMAAPSRNGDSYKQADINLQNEIECFRSSFVTWIDTHRSYSESLNGWLQKCILQPQERLRGRKVPFSPRRALAPPIFVLCRDWLAGIQRLPVEEVCDSLKKLITILSELLEEHRKDEKQEDRSEQGNDQNKEVNPCKSLVRLQESMTSTFECLVKFSEESVKVYEGVKQENQNARDAYSTSDWFRL
ncbi:hypothetical protein KFK09_013157 [Dendrobium nobile]|uniref:Uncharacterized protein n=1 Tax=Dendrobium nobile TaxID=94219 RepID=A0A8T3BCD3_DENNO|nr:hypothetical protein KFK09_013157 [Dendrobium nobile]